MSSNAIITTHKLDFEVAESPYDVFKDGHKMFRIGTCEGQWGCTKDSFYILSVKNSVPNNGHLDDVFEWFEYSCKRDGRNLLVLECMNSKFYQHMIYRRGFVALDEQRRNCIKIFNTTFYNELLKRGNGIIQAGSLQCV